MNFIKMTRENAESYFSDYESDDDLLLLSEEDLRFDLVHAFLKGAEDTLEVAIDEDSDIETFLFWDPAKESGFMLYDSQTWPQNDVPANSFDELIEQAQIDGPNNPFA